VIASAGLLLAALPSGMALASGGDTWVVHPGESIQAAVDRAQSGDTIQIEAGTYSEGVCIDGKGLTIVGAGRDDTRIVWPEWTDRSQLPEVAATPCWEAQNAVDPESDPTTLKDDVSGLFFLNPDGPVKVSGVSTWNQPASGIAAWGAHGFSVRKTAGHAHDKYGIVAVNSTHTRITRNIEVGLDRGTPEVPNSGTAGILVGDSDAAYADIGANDVEGFNLGIFARESRSGAIHNNYASGNCVGILVFDDAATEIPDASRNVEAGDWQIYGNESTANDRFCLAGIGEVDASLRVSGTGMSIVNADAVSVRNNNLHDNAPSVDPATLDFPSGGLTLLSLPPFNNAAGVDAGPVENVSVAHNSIRRNVPVDVLVGSPDVSQFLVAPGPGLEFRDNSCGSSVPPAVCNP
jgi:hypothetical protein